MTVHFTYTDVPEAIFLHQLVPQVGEIPVLSETFEINWLPVLGPTTTCLVRRLARSIRDGVLEGPFTPEELLAPLGVHQKVIVRKAIARGIQFQVLRIEGPVIAVPTTMPARPAIKTKREREEAA